MNDSPGNVVGDDMLGMPAPAFTADPASESADLLGEGGGYSSTPAQPPPPPAPAAVDLLGMGDLLGDSSVGADPFAVSQAPPAVPQFSLAQGVNMTGQQFEGYWSRLPQAQNQMKQMRSLPQLTTAMVEESLRPRGISVIASGPQPGSLKFFFYAKQGAGPAAAGLSSDIWFLLELVMSTVPGGTAQASIKAENAQSASVELFVNSLWEALDAYVIR